MRLASLLPPLAAASALASSLAAQSALGQSEWPSQFPNDRLGASVAILDDLTGDGIAELLVGAPGSATTVGARADAFIFQIGSAAPLRSHPGKFAANAFGEQVAALDDLDGDGIGDYAVSAIRRNFFGEVDVFSGATGALLTVITPPAGTSSLFGFAIEQIGDLNGDGLEDVAISAPDVFAGGFGGNPGQVHIFLSGASSFSFVRTLTGVGTNDGLGDDLCFLGGGVLAAGAPFIPVTGAFVIGGGGVFFFNVNTGTTAFPFLERLTPLTNEFFGTSLASPGDLNGDGINEIAVGIRSPGGFLSGAVELYNVLGGPTGSNPPLGSRVFSGIDRTGEFLNAVSDLNGDGVTDLVAGGLINGTVELLDSTSPSLTSIASTTTGRGISPSASAADVFANGGFGLLIGGIGGAGLEFPAGLIRVGQGCSNITTPGTLTVGARPLQLPTAANNIPLTVTSFYSPGVTAGLLFDFVAPTPTPFPSGCLNYLGPAPITLAIFTAQAGMPFTATLQIPALAGGNLNGVTVTAQTVFLSGSGFETTNAVTGVVGDF